MAKGTAISGSGGKPGPKSNSSAPYPANPKPPFPGAPAMPQGAPTANIKGADKLKGGR